MNSIPKSITTVAGRRQPIGVGGFFARTILAGVE
jgi:hypothetical protein